MPNVSLIDGHVDEPHTAASKCSTCSHGIFSEYTGDYECDAVVDWTFQRSDDPWCPKYEEGKPTLLKSCPFCGEKARIREATIEEQGSVVNGYFSKYCGCPNCWSEKWGQTAKEAVEKWNRRAGDESRSI